MSSTREPKTPRPRAVNVSPPLDNRHPSSRSEAVVAALVEQAHDDRINALQRAEAVCALKSYLQADWDQVASVVGMSARSVMAMASLLKLPEPVRLALRQRLLDLRHGAAVARLLDHEAAMLRLFDHLILHPEITGEVALRMASLMTRDVDVDLDAARRTAEAKVGQPPTNTTAPEATPLFEALQHLETVDIGHLTAQEQLRLAADLRKAADRIAMFEQRLARK